MYTKFKNELSRCLRESLRKFKTAEIMKEELGNYRRARNREKALEQGFYDGRFRNRRQETKKQKQQPKKRFNNFDEDQD